MRKAETYHLEPEDNFELYLAEEMEDIFQFDRRFHGFVRISENGTEVGEIDYIKHTLTVYGEKLKEVVEEYIGSRASVVDSSTSE